MPERVASGFTSLGAGIWCAILVYIGYLHGRHEDALKEAVLHAAATKAFMYLVPALALLVVGYVIWHRRRTRGAAAGAE